MDKSIVTIKTVDGKDFILYRDNSDPTKTYVEIDGVMTEISVKDFMDKYGR